MASAPETRTRTAPLAIDQTRLRAVVLLASLASFLLSVSLFFFAGNENQGIFVGLWVPSILGLGSVLLSGDRS